MGILGNGANYMRELEIQANKIEPGKFQKIKSATVKAFGKVLVPVATTVLTDYVGSHLYELAKAISNHL